MKKILVIEDETITIQIIRFTLEENANLEVITAADGSKAIEYLENNFCSSSKTAGGQLIEF